MVEIIEKERILSDTKQTLKNLESVFANVQKFVEYYEKVTDNKLKLEKYLEWISYLNTKRQEILNFLDYISWIDKITLDKFQKVYLDDSAKKINNYFETFGRQIDFMKSHILEIYVSRHWEIMKSVDLFSMSTDKLIELYSLPSYDLMDFLRKNNLIKESHSSKEIVLYKSKERQPTKGKIYLITSENLDSSSIIRAKNPEIKEFWWLKTNSNWFISIALLWVDAWNVRADAIKQILIDPTTWKISIITILRDIKVKKTKWPWKLNELGNETAYKKVIEEITWQDVTYTSRFDMNSIVSEFTPSFNALFPNWVKLSKLTNSYLISNGWVNKEYNSNTSIKDLNELLFLVRARHDWWLLWSSWEKKQKIDLFWDVLRTKRQSELVNSILSQFISNFSVSGSIDWIKKLPDNFLKENWESIWYTTLTRFAKDYYSKFWSSPSLQSIEPKINWTSGWWTIFININWLRSDIKRFFYT